MARISVIIPTFNRAGLLKQAVDSVLCQTCQDAEVIVVDDGSTDGTDALLSRYGNAIVAIRQDHAGAAAARNTGIRMATGAFVTFADSDDLLSPIALAAQATFLEEHPDVAIVYCGWQTIDQSGTRVLNTVVPTQPEDMATALLTHGVSYPPQMITGATMLRRRLLEQSPGFDESMGTAEDVLFWIRLAAAGHTFGCNPQVLYLWRETDGSLGRDLETIRENIPVVLDRMFNATDLPPHLKALYPRAAANAYLGTGNLYLRAYFLTEDRQMLDRAVSCAAEAVRFRPSVLDERKEFWERAVYHAGLLDDRGRQTLLTAVSRIYPTEVEQQLLYTRLQNSVQPPPVVMPTEGRDAHPRARHFLTSLFRRQAE